MAAREAQQTSQAFSTATFESVSNIDSYVAAFSQITKSTSIHKSLDLSNVGVIPENQADKTNKHLRQFHQTRIYVQNFAGMYHHTKDWSNKTTYLISANLPESLSYSIGSKWSAPLSSFGSNSLFNALMQVVGSKFGIASGINRATTLKIWDGVDPLSLSLKIPVLDDGYEQEQNQTGYRTNLAEALEFLGCLCLPKEDLQFGFYVPPPSPLDISIKYGKDKTDAINFHSTKARIMIQLGGILLLDNCIIEGIDVEYPNTKTLIRHHYANGINPGGTSTGTDYLTPLLAFVTIKISTVEAITSETFSKMLWLKAHSMGKGQADVYTVASKTASTMGNILTEAKDTVKNDWLNPLKK